MIPRANITAWRGTAPWLTDAQVEQDLVLSRALVEIYSAPLLSKAFAFRGGTAFNKLYLHPPARYSEDIDLVQVEAGQIGPLLDAIRARLDPWLGAPKRKASEGGVTLTYRFDSEIPPVTPLRLKVEINTREHFTVGGHRSFPFQVANPWHEQTADVTTFSLEELMATKLRALYQRKKGRDLFDLWIAMEQFPELEIDKTVRFFRAYLEHSNLAISRVEFEANLANKMADPAFTDDVVPLLATEQDGKPRAFDSVQAYEQIRARILALLPD